MTKPNWIDEACKLPPTTAEQVVIERLARQEAERQRDEALQLRHRVVAEIERDLAETRRLLVIERDCSEHAVTRCMETERERDEARAERDALARVVRTFAAFLPEPLAQALVVLATKGDKDAVQALRTAVEAPRKVLR